MQCYTLIHFQATDKSLAYKFKFYIFFLPKQWTKMVVSWLQKKNVSLFALTREDVFNKQKLVIK